MRALSLFFVLLGAIWPAIPASAELAHPERYNGDSREPFRTGFLEDPSRISIKGYCNPAPYSEDGVLQILRNNQLFIEIRVDFVCSKGMVSAYARMVRETFFRTISEAQKSLELAKRTRKKVIVGDFTSGGTVHDSHLERVLIVDSLPPFEPGSDFEKNVCRIVRTSSGEFEGQFFHSDRGVQFLPAGRGYYVNPQPYGYSLRYQGQDIKILSSKENKPSGLRWTFLHQRQLRYIDYTLKGEFCQVLIQANEKQFLFESYNLVMAAFEFQEEGKKRK
ncbi:MAG: hypothetical protein K2X47_12530 [Bdellovibrionales bacterium]|nr:hypothetical protein [Bdellovibrionales bacterium]